MKRLLKRVATSLLLGAHVGLYRLTGGRIGGRFFTMDAILLTTRGRRSGRDRTMPLSYFPDDQGRMVLVASNGGMPSHPGWYHNLKAEPEATIQVRERKLRVRAEELTEAEAEAMWPRVVATWAGYGTYREKTDRRIRLLRLVPLD